MTTLNDFLNIVVSELLVKDNYQITENTSFRDLPNWSSLNALLLISKLNEKYGVFISSADLGSIKSLGQLYQLIGRKLNGN